ncbi:DUF3995 domain-containing protein [Actinokineospora fastidiosa]|uniref:DUF3995 domain-containing protein n=1 Tax=Actinokineospora fastidiosa TaxID=1816 RepID=A0A918LIE0_9PSEU|nr:DUF3995 domain-containing protein [Actinokineospora fastidiosa]GGS55935.1 hypothetical protein GCM10010171_58610 [Actinokineospora fastidiosa]
MTVVVWALVVALVLIAIQHVVWMISPWPLRTPEELARKVVGVEADRLPSRPLTFGVVVLLAAAAYLVAARGGLVDAPGPEWLVTVGAGGVAVVLLARGLSGMATSLRRDTEFAHWDVRIYSPLSLTLGVLGAVVTLLA